MITAKLIKRVALTLPLANLTNLESVEVSQEYKKPEEKDKYTIVSQSEEDRVFRDFPEFEATKIIKYKK